MDKDVAYCRGVLSGEITAPQYVRMQCADYLRIYDGEDKTYCVDTARREQTAKLCALMVVPTGPAAGKSVYEALYGWQWLLIMATLTVVYRSEPHRRRYETAVLEIARKNGKTFLTAVLLLLLFLLEPKFSKFFSVAPDGTLSRLIQEQMRQIVQSSPALRDRFKLRRDDITCLLNQNQYKPLAFSTSRMDGHLPNAFVADEVGALPINYPVEAMRSGQVTIRNRLGCIISTKYPTIENPFEDEVKKAKAILSGEDSDETYFALLYEPDDPKHWETGDEVILHANPLSADIPAVMEDIQKKRRSAILYPSERQNFLTKHLNIIYQGVGTETYVDPADVIACRRTEPIDWRGKTVYVGVDFSETTDNTAVAIAALKGETVLADAWGFIPEDRMEEKSRREKIDYARLIEEGCCFACGGRVIDYAFVEEFVFSLEERLGCTVAAIGFDRRNALSSAQKWAERYTTAEIRQHSSVLHSPSKLLRERIIEGHFAFYGNRLLVLNFQNARVRFDTNLNMYVDKKHSAGKVDLVVALINAMYLLEEYELHGDGFDGSWAVMV